MVQLGAVTEPWETDTTFLWGTVTLKAHLISGQGVLEGAVVLEARRGSLSPGEGKNDGKNPPHLLPWWWDT